MAQATITKRQEWNKVGRVDFTVDGKSGSAAFWKGDAFAVHLTEGATVELTFEKKPKKDKPDETEVWISSVNGESAKAKAYAGGGGGGRPQQPKAAIEVHASCIAGIIKSAIEQGDADGTLARAHIKVYKEAVEQWA